MGPELLFAIVVFIFGLGLMIFAKPLGIRQQNFDAGVVKYFGDSIWAKRWQVLVDPGVKFQVRFFRIAGILMMCIALFVVMTLTCSPKRSPVIMLVQGSRILIKRSYLLIYWSRNNKIRVSVDLVS